MTIFKSYVLNLWNYSVIYEFTSMRMLFLNDERIGCLYLGNDRFLHFENRRFIKSLNNKRAMALYTCVDKGNKNATGFWQPLRRLLQPPNILIDQI